jgi:hypothetical protein
MFADWRWLSPSTVLALRTLRITCGEQQRTKYPKLETTTTQNNVNILCWTRVSLRFRGAFREAIGDFPRSPFLKYSTPADKRK